MATRTWQLFVWYFNVHEMLLNKNTDLFNELKIHINEVGRSIDTWFKFRQIAIDLLFLCTFTQ